MHGNHTVNGNDESVAFEQGRIVPAVYPVFNDEDSPPLYDPKNEADHLREICMRYADWNRCNIGRPIEILRNMVRLYMEDPAALMWFVDSVADGTYYVNSESYAERGARVVCSKQNIEQTEKRRRKVVEKYFPGCHIENHKGRDSSHG